MSGQRWCGLEEVTPARGEALYLGTDGVGALVGGPPPIGIKIQAVFNTATNSIHFDLIEHGKVIGHGSASYDPSQKVIDSGGARHELLRRRSSELTDEMKSRRGFIRTHQETQS